MATRNYDVVYVCDFVTFTCTHSICTGWVSDAICASRSARHRCLDAFLTRSEPLERCVLLASCAATSVKRVPRFGQPSVQVGPTRTSLLDNKSIWVVDALRAEGGLRLRTRAPRACKRAVATARGLLLIPVGSSVPCAHASDCASSSV